MKLRTDSTFVAHLATIMTYSYFRLHYGQVKRWTGIFVLVLRYSEKYLTVSVCTWIQWDRNQRANLDTLLCVHVDSYSWARVCKIHAHTTDTLSLLNLDLCAGTDNHDSRIGQISRRNNTRAFWPCRTRVKTHNRRLSYRVHAASAYIQH